MSMKVATCAAQLGFGIRQLRKERGSTQSRFASDVGVCRDTLSALERGQADFSFLLVEQIAAALDTSVLGILATGRKTLLESGDELTKTVAGNLKSRRKHLGMTARVLSQRIGLTSQYISELEHAKRLPGIKNFTKFAIGLECSPSSLLQNDMDWSDYSSSGPALVLEKEELGERVRRERERRNLKLLDVMMVSGINHTFLAEVERGDKAASLLTLMSLAEALRVPVSTLID